MKSQSLFVQKIGICLFAVSSLAPLAFSRSLQSPITPLGHHQSQPSSEPLQASVSPTNDTTRISPLRAIWKMTYFLGGLPGVVVLRNKALTYRSLLERQSEASFSSFPLPKEIYQDQPAAKALLAINATGILNLLESAGSKINDIVFPDLDTLKGSKADASLFHSYFSIAKNIMSFIPGQCPAEQMGGAAVCHYNPLFDHLIALRMRAEEFAANYKSVYSDNKL